MKEHFQVNAVSHNGRYYFPDWGEQPPLNDLNAVSEKLKLPIGFLVDARQAWLDLDPNPFYTMDDIHVGEQGQPQKFIGLCADLNAVPLACQNTAFVVLEAPAEGEE